MVKLIPNWFRRSLGLPEDEAERAERADFDPGRRKFCFYGAAASGALILSPEIALPRGRIIAPAEASRALVAPKLTEVVQFGNGPQFDIAQASKDLTRKLYYKIGRTWFENEVSLDGQMKTIRSFSGTPPGMKDIPGFPEPVVELE